MVSDQIISTRGDQRGRPASRQCAQLGHPHLSATRPFLLLPPHPNLIRLCSLRASDPLSLTMFTPPSHVHTSVSMQHECIITPVSVCGAITSPLCRHAIRVHHRSLSECCTSTSSHLCQYAVRFGTLGLGGRVLGSADRTAAAPGVGLQPVVAINRKK